MTTVNSKTKPIPIKNSSSSSTKYSSTSPPLSTSSSGASPQTSSSSNESPATTIQTLIVRPTNASAAHSNTVGGGSKKNIPASKIKSSEQEAQRIASGNNSTSTPHALSSNSSSRIHKHEAPTKLEASGGSNSSVSTQNTNGANGASYHHHHISSDILDDLASRFIINVPDDERNNLIRICFQIELAHWFYLDFFCAGDEKKCGMKQFAMSLFQHIPFLRKHLPTIDKILENWKQYKLTVPTYGAILLSEDLSHVLLVQSYWAKSSWGFPKGKVNENEDPIHCATREVFEETGYDITHLIVQSDYIESIINDQYTRLYLVRHVPLKTHFMPRTRKEIKCCEWFSIDALPINKNDANTKQSLGINANSFFMIMPFIKRLKKWVAEKRSGSIDISTSLQNINKFKLNGPYPNSIHNFNNATLANNKKTDTKMPFKTAQSNTATPGNQNSNLANTQNNSSKLSSSKRQRHKSMGDLDGMVRYSQTMSSFQNNLRLMNATNQQANQASTSVFNDLTSGNQSEQRDKNQRQNIRRQKSMQGGNSYKPTEVPAIVACPSNSGHSVSTTSSIRIASYHYDCVKESNLDPVKLEATKQSADNPKMNNADDIMYYNYGNRNAFKDAGQNENLRNFFDPKRSISNSKKVPQVPVAKLSNKPTKLNKPKGESQVNVKPATDEEIVQINSIPAVSKDTNAPDNLSLPLKQPAPLKSSPHFDAWKDFSFKKSCITNVFF